MKRVVECLFSAVLLAGLMGSAQAAKLGDAAAALSIKDWVKGKPVDVKDGKNVYLVSFWTTWCPGCRKSIPYLTEFQKKYRDKGVVIVGVSHEDTATVREFVEMAGDRMDYTVATDDAEKTNLGYMEAYGQETIPMVFVVGKDSKVLWFGHPTEELEPLMDRILAGKYDVQAEVRRRDGENLIRDYLVAAHQGNPQAKEIGRKTITQLTNEVRLLSDLAFNIAANPHLANRDFTLAEEALSQAEKSAGTNTVDVIGARAVVRFESGKEQEGMSLARRALEQSTAPMDKMIYQQMLRVMENRLAQKKQTASP